MRVIVGVTGASGAIYGYALIQALAGLGVETHAVYTEMGAKVLEYECGVDLAEISRFAKVHSNQDLFAPLASGSYKTDGMVVAPCSMHTLGALANGGGRDLLTRAADVTLKEGRRLVVVPREAPVTAIHLENMLKLSRAGVMILPASPAFYHRPHSLSDIIAFMTGKILDALGIEHDLVPRWGE